MKFIEAVDAKLVDMNVEKIWTKIDLILATLEAARNKACDRQETEDMNNALYFLESLLSELRPPKPPEVRLAEIVDAWLRRDVVDSPEALSLVSEILEREKGK